MPTVNGNSGVIITPTLNENFDVITPTMNGNFGVITPTVNGNFDVVTPTAIRDFGVNTPTMNICTINVLWADLIWFG